MCRLGFVKFEFLPEVKDKTWAVLSSCTNVSKGKGEVRHQKMEPGSLSQVFKLDFVKIFLLHTSFLPSYWIILIDHFYSQVY